MALVAERPTLVGDLVKYEFLLSHGYERQVKTLTVALNAKIGEVYADDGTITVAADVNALAVDGSTPLFILVDDKIYTDGHTAASQGSYVVLAGGPGASGGAVVVREQLKFGDALSSGQVDDVVEVLESQGIKVGTQI